MLLEKPGMICAVTHCIAVVCAGVHRPVPLVDERSFATVASLLVTVTVSGAPPARTLCTSNPVVAALLPGGFPGLMPTLTPNPKLEDIAVAAGKVPPLGATDGCTTVTDVTLDV